MLGHLRHRHPHREPLRLRRQPGALRPGLLNYYYLAYMNDSNFRFSGTTAEYGGVFCNASRAAPDSNMFGRNSASIRIADSSVSPERLHCDLETEDSCFLLRRSAAAPADGNGSLHSSPSTIHLPGLASGAKPTRA